MNTNQVKSNDAFKITGNWDAQSKQLKSKYSQLTDSDLKFEEGKENELLGRVETRLNKKRDEVINIINKNQSEKHNQSMK
ncbi:MAG: hypothetical protein ACQETL_09315 [Bacteroidota bacterium]